MQKPGIQRPVRFVVAMSCTLLLLIIPACRQNQPHGDESVDPPVSLETQFARGRSGAGSGRVQSDQPVTDSEFALLTAGSDQERSDPGDEAWLTELVLDAGSLGDESCLAISKFPKLRHLRLRHCDISDEGLEDLASCESLQILNLPHSEITASGLDALQSLPDLRMLRLGGGRLTEATATALEKLGSLRQLHLIGVPIDDEGLRKLASLPKLQSLYLDDSAVTEAGWDWLFETHPSLHVHVNAEHLDRDPNHAAHHD